MSLFLNEKLEELIEHAGSIEAPECEAHRYALRRMLLNSSYFDEHRSTMRRRAMLLMPVVASGFFVAVLFMATQTSSGSNTPESLNEPLLFTNSFDQGSLTEGLSATFVDDRPIIPVAYEANKVSFSTASMVLNVD